MINGEYDSACKPAFKDKKWKVLWEEFLKKSNYWDEEKQINVLGEKPNDEVIVKIPELKDFKEKKEYNRKLIGEFIRIHHHRLADDIASKGYIGYDIFQYNKASGTDDFPKYLQLAGLVARSHGMAIRDTFDYLREENSNFWYMPKETHIIYLMSLLRLADLLDITKERSNAVIQGAQKMYSPFSRLEHAQHNAINSIDYGNLSNDSEVINVELELNGDVKTYVKIKDYVNYIQQELDTTWAVLGEVYGNDFTLLYRRIKINCSDKVFERKYKLIPKQYKFRLNDDLAKLLIIPLYGNNPSFGVRELVQNAVDACRECMNDTNNGEEPHVDVRLDTKTKLFTITDTGKGMTLEEIEKYFLTIGSSYNDDIKWKQMRDVKGLYRTGHFGIGVLASFLIGNKITVETKSRKDNNNGYNFDISLSDKFVEISIDNNLNYGTKISINCNDSCLKQLRKAIEENKDYYKHKRVYEWYNWYIDEKPIVRYFYNEEQIEPDRTEWDDYKELKCESKEFGAIRFKTLNLFAPYNSSPSLYCNGFFITSRSNKRYFSNPFLILNYPLVDFPSLQIDDRHNRLPLNLSRTNIDGSVRYDFEEDLAKEVCKDLICQLMVISNISVIIKCEIKKHVLFGKDGYAFNNLYTQKKVLNNNKCIIYLHVYSINYRLIFLLLSQWYTNYDKEEKCLFCLVESEYVPNSINIYAYKRIEDPDLTLYSEELEEEEIIIDEHIGYQIKTTQSSKHFIELLKKFIDFQNANDLSINFICITDSPHPFFLSKEQVEELQPYYDLFDKYMDKNPIIPYNIAERKSRFKTIYSEFSEKIDYYREYWNNRIRHGTSTDLPSNKEEGIEDFFPT